MFYISNNYQKYLFQDAKKNCGLCKCLFYNYTHFVDCGGLNITDEIMRTRMVFHQYSIVIDLTNNKVKYW